MTKSVLVNKLAEKVSDLTRTQTEIVVDTIIESIQQALIKGDKVEIRGFGNFRLRKRKPRQARNPRTGEQVEVPAKKVVFFKIGKELKEMLNSERKSK